MNARDPNDYFPQDDLDAPAASPVRAGKAGYIAPEKMFSEGCKKCRGTGRYGNFGMCFACKGAGKFTFKTSPEARAKAQDRAVAKRESKAVADRAWQAEHADVIAWLRAAALSNSQRNGTFTFPTDLLAKLHQYGTLTDGQLGAVRKLMARDVERAAARVVERAEREASAPVVDAAGVDRLKAAFDQAAAYTAAKAKGLTVRSPKLTIGGITISPAKAHSKNPGALYVKAGETYLGKIAGGRFVAMRECTPEQQAQVLKFVESPADAAKVYGQETGVCCVCNATLRSEWRLRGIGPICAEKFGW
jgi:hypothetical protein